MSRGKYATRAALRREDTGVRSEIESYKHHIQRLTGENKHLAGRLAESQAAHKEEARKLRAMLDEGLSPELLALREELERQRELANKAEQHARRTREIWGHVLDGVFRLLKEGLGLTGLEAYEVLLVIDPEIPARTEPITLIDPDFGTSMKGRL